jgi:hypothetical protein
MCAACPTYVFHGARKLLRCLPHLLSPCLRLPCLRLRSLRFLSLRHQPYIMPTLLTCSHLAYACLACADLACASYAHLADPTDAYLTHPAAALCHGAYFTGYLQTWVPILQGIITYVYSGLLSRPWQDLTPGYTSP